MRPGIGVGVFIMNSSMDKFLMSKRKDCGRFALIGGHLERFESICQCAQRECLEESSLSIPLQKEYPKSFNVICQEDDYHYITFFTVAIAPEDQHIINTEPQKHENWDWVGKQQFITYYQNNQLFYALQNIFKYCNEDFSLLLSSLQNLTK